MYWQKVYDGAMRIERINENSIRCTLTSFDLSVRDLNLKELAYGTEKAKKLFAEMMTRASDEVGFETDGTPIMIEAIPMSSDSIQLVITKVDNPEELDARFSRFSQGPDGSKVQRMGPDDWLHKLTSDLLEGASGFLQKMQDMQQKAPEAPKEGAAKPGSNAPNQGQPKEQKLPEVIYRAFGFDSLLPVFDAAKAAAFYDGESTLYKKPGTEKYVLLIRGTQENRENFSKVCNVLTEYGYSIRTTGATGAYYDEHYEVITPSPAIEKLAGIR